MDCFEDNEKPVRGIIVAPDITENAKEELEKLEMEFIPMDPPLDLLKRKTATLDSFF